MVATRCVGLTRPRVRVCGRARPPPPEQKASQLIKETMDKKFGATWHVCIGEGFGFEVTYQARNLMYLYYSAKLGVLVFKC